MLQTQDQVDLRERLIEEHAQSRKRVIGIKAKLEAHVAALDLASAHVACAIQGIENPGMDQAFGKVPTPEQLIALCDDYRAAVAHSLQLATALAELGN
jgi:hypothetical protein